MFFSGGSYAKPKDGTNSNHQNYQDKSSGFHPVDHNLYHGTSAGPKPIRLQQPPVTINVHSVEGKDFEIQLLEGLLETYFNIVRTNLIDQVPKAVMFFMVSKSKQQMQNELVRSLYKDQNFERLFEESLDIVSKRKAAKNLLAVLQKAQNIMNEVRDYKLPKDFQSLDKL